MQKVIAIAGLPASGKTHYGRTLAQRLGADFIDDPGRNGLEPIHQTTADLVVVADPTFCFPTTREKAEQLFRELGATTIEWIFFANDPTQCLRNATLRPDQKVDGEIRYFSAKYEIPQGITPLPVYSGK